MYFGVCTVLYRLCLRCTVLYRLVPCLCLVVLYRLRLCPLYREVPSLSSSSVFVFFSVVLYRLVSLLYRLVSPSPCCTVLLYRLSSSSFPSVVPCCTVLYRLVPSVFFFTCGSFLLLCFSGFVLCCCCVSLVLLCRCKFYGLYTG